MSKYKSLNLFLLLALRAPHLIKLDNENENIRAEYLRHFRGLFQWIYMMQQTHSMKDETPKLISIKLMSFQQVICRLESILCCLSVFVKEILISMETVSFFFFTLGLLQVYSSD